MAIQLGSVNLLPDFKIPNVLFIPKIQFNLISLAQLCQDLNCFAILSDDMCHLHDCTSMRPIGVDEQRNEIFSYKPVNLLSCFTFGGVVSGSRELWYIRLGHPSDTLVNKFFDQSSLHVSKNFGARPCSICVYAKQTRYSFPLSSNNQIAIFLFNSL